MAIKVLNRGKVIEVVVGGKILWAGEQKEITEVVDEGKVVVVSVLHAGRSVSIGFFNKAR